MQIGHCFMYVVYIDMVVSGIPTRTGLHAREIANMALEIVAACKVFVIPHRPNEPLKIRVGLHSGKMNYLCISRYSDFNKKVLWR